jgi:hypothetical protein
VMAHWLWQIKRLATGKRTQHDMMPILYGTQGRGKSTATERLTDPWRELVTEIKAENLTDERKLPLLVQCSIGRWEEMQGASKSDVASLKNTITTPFVSWRPLNTNVHERMLRTMGFIGTSNEHVDQLIADQTGMRRFFEIPAELIDQAAINSINYELLWQAVSENDPAPILPHLVEIRARQVELIHRDVVILWLEAETWQELHLVPMGQAFDSTPGGGPPKVKIPAYDPVKGETYEHLCMRFRFWCTEVGQPQSQITKLAARLGQEGWTIIRPKPGGGGARQRRYFRPVEPVAGAELTASGPTRAERMAADPHPGEDRFAQDSNKPSTASLRTPEEEAFDRLEREAIQGEDDIHFSAGPPDP